VAEKIILQPVWSSNSLLAFEIEKPKSVSGFTGLARAKKCQAVGGCPSGC